MEQASCFYCSKEAKNKCDFCKSCFICDDSHHADLHRHLSSQTCLPFRVARSSSKGRVLVASRDLRPFDLVLREDTDLFGPFVPTPESSTVRMEAKCVVCLAQIEEGVDCCRSCQSGLCSSPTCQSLHSRVGECPLLCNLPSKSKTNRLILPLRIRLTRTAHPDIDCLQSHLDLRQG